MPAHNDSPRLYEVALIHRPPDGPARILLQPTAILQSTPERAGRVAMDRLMEQSPSISDTTAAEHVSILVRDFWTNVVTELTKPV